MFWFWMNFCLQDGDIRYWDFYSSISSTLDIDIDIHRLINDLIQFFFPWPYFSVFCDTAGSHSLIFGYIFRAVPFHFFVFSFMFIPPLIVCLLVPLCERSSFPCMTRFLGLFFLFIIFIGFHSYDSCYIQIENQEDESIKNCW